MSKMDATVPRIDVLDRGKALAERIIGQYWRCTLAPHNLEEGRKLDKLREQWAVWEQQAPDAGIDPQTEFGDTLRWLRPQKPKPVRAIHQKRSLSMPDLVLPARVKRARLDHDSAGGSAIWDLGY